MRARGFPALYPELSAGGFTRNDGTVLFYTRVRALLGPDARIIDFGAGRGRSAEDTCSYRRELQNLRGPARRVIGVDVDPAVLQNTKVDEAVIIEASGTLPFDDASVDVVVSDFTFEHVDRPEAVAAELARVLRPGGWLCARTPNRRGYVALGARLVPNKSHVAVLGRLQPRRQAEDVFPTVYGMNTLRRLEQLFPSSDFVHASYGHHMDPSYVADRALAARTFRTLNRVLPEALAPILMVFMQKREASPASERAGDGQLA